MKRKSSPHSASDGSLIMQPKRARLGWLDEIDPPKQDQAGPSNYRPSSLSDLYDNDLSKRPELNQMAAVESSPLLPLPPTSTSIVRHTTLSNHWSRDAARQNHKRYFLCALCTSFNTQGLQLWNVSEGGKNDSLTVHQHCLENIPEMSIATADGFVGWAVVMDSQRFRRRFNLGCSVCHNAHGAKIQCINSGCTQAFHVTCAVEHPNVVFEPTEDDPIPYRLLCSQHNTESREKRRRRKNRPVAKEAIRAAALIRATNGDLVHIRVPEDGDTDDGFFDPPEMIDAVYVCNVDVENKTVDVSASPLRGPNANVEDGIYTIRWDEVVIDQQLLSLIPDSDPDANSDAEPQTRSQDMMEDGPEDVPEDAYPSSSASAQSVPKASNAPGVQSVQIVFHSNSASPSGTQQQFSSEPSSSSPSKPLALPNPSNPSSKGPPLSEPGPEPETSYPSASDKPNNSTQTFESVQYGGSGSVSSPASTSLIMPLTPDNSLRASLPSSQSLSQSRTTPSVQSSKGKAAEESRRKCRGIGEIPSFSPYPTASERHKRSERKEKKGKKGNANANAEEETYEAIIEKAQKTQLGLDASVVFLDSPKVVKAVSNFLFEDPEWNAHFGSILERYNNNKQQ